MHLSMQTDGTIEDLFGEDRNHQIQLLTDEEARKALHVETDEDFIDGVRYASAIGNLNQQDRGELKHLRQEENIDIEKCQEENIILLIQRVAQDVWFDAIQTAIKVQCNPSQRHISTTHNTQGK